MGIFSCFARPKDAENAPAFVPEPLPPSAKQFSQVYGQPQSSPAPAPTAADGHAEAPTSDAKQRATSQQTSQSKEAVATGADQTPQKAADQPNNGDTRNDTATASDSPTRWSASKEVKHLSTAVQGPADFAAVLRPFTSESADGPVQHFISTLGKHGAGLAEAATAHPDVGHIFGAAYRLHRIAHTVVVNRENSAMLAALGQDVVRALEVAGKKATLPAAAVLEALLQQLRDAGDLAEVFGRPGWLLHLACNDHIKADFDSQHNTIVDALEAAGLEVPGKAHPLPRGVYLDASRNLRRTLKRIGSGSVPQGLKTAATDLQGDSIREVASQLAVGADAVARELAGLPPDVPADAYYSRMVLRQQGGAALATRRYKPIFDWYDKSGRGWLDRGELVAVLADLGALEGLRPAEAEAAAVRAFSLADQDADGRVTPEEFARYYDTLTCSNARKQLRLAMGLHVEAELKQFFNEFCAFGTRQAVEEMDSAHFVKLFKDCNLMSKDMTVTDIDLAFTRAKPKGARKLGFDGFLSALAECAERKGTALEGLVRSILESEGPIARATKADNVRLHDDKSTYTGVYAKGGPRVAEKSHDLAAMLDRSDAAHQAAAVRKPPVRPPRSITIVETPVERSPQPEHPSVALSGRLCSSGMWDTPNRRRSSAGGSGHFVIPPPGTTSALHDMWLMWAQFGVGSGPAHSRPEMGVTQFIKMMRETGLVDRSFSTVQAELIFTRIKPKGATKLSFEAFERALQLVAEVKGCKREQLEAAILKSEGPQLNHAKA